jgi:hypothetical protein
MWLHYYKNVLVLLFIFILFHIILAQDNNEISLEEENLHKINNEVITTRVVHPDLYLTTVIIFN